MNLEILLVNTLTITATKVQTVIEDFMQEEIYTSIFCFTETKVDNPNFKPIGIKIFTKQRGKKYKKGGGLMIGFKDDKKTIMEEIKVENNDILALEGKIRGCKTRIILVYMDSTKNKTGKDFDRNRKIQAQVEKLFEVEPDVSLICLGDINGRLKKLEPDTETDCNGIMIEDWISKFNLNHLNQTEECIGTYTFSTTNGKSAIDHILVNNKLYSGYKGMHINEDKTLLNISDHCLVRAWFKLGSIPKVDWKKPKYKTITWVRKDEESYEVFKKAFKKHIGKNTSFNKFMKKMKMTIDAVLIKKQAGLRPD